MALTQVNSNGVKNDSIVNEDIKSDAAIAFSKLASTPTVLTGSTNNTICTVTGHNSINGETNLTFDGNHLTQTIDASAEGIKITAAGNHYPAVSCDANRTTEGNTVAWFEGRWNGTSIGGISIEAGDDTVNKDDGKISFYTTASGTQTKKMAIEQDGNVEITDGNLVVASGHGIDFSANSHAGGMTSELLDGYEEGTFTPSWGPNTGSYTSIGYASQDGYYVKVGRVVNVWFRLNVNAINTSGGSGYLKLSGLPFTATSGHGVDGGTLNVNYYTNAISNMGDQVPSGYVQSGNTTVVMGKQGGNQWNNIDHADLGTVNFYAHMTYYANA